MSIEERELKLTPVDPNLLDQLEQQSSFGPFNVIGRSYEAQRNGFFDTRDRALQSARIGFRRRVIGDRPQATWTLKAEGALYRGIAARPEIELQLGADLPPALVLGALREAARQRGAMALAEQVADAMSGSGLPLAAPVLETDNERRILDLHAAREGWRTELTLDQVRLVRHSSYVDVEIEVELKRGDDEALEAARVAIEAIGEVRESVGSKLSRAIEHLEHCRCSA